MTPLPPRPRLAFMASHNGSNMRAIVAACRDGTLAAEPVLAISNNRDSPALVWARENGLAAVHLSAAVAGSDDALDAAIEQALCRHRIDLVVLAGYMRKLGPRTLAAYKNRILNVHPALLPKFGGQGMYGRFVHEAVLAAGEAVTGATIHVVDGEYDHGPVVAQADVRVMPDDSPDTLAARVQAKERDLFPDTLRRIIAGAIDLDRLA
ncbi:MAG: phosphoribosylglycinamide formyltransferase [Rhodospirillaceae bacterium]|nr:phosphoribosylglycinamide formyltransferase [Rhodospirillaceae bacterium]